MKANFSFRTYLLLYPLTLSLLTGCIVLSDTKGESEWSIGVENKNALVLHRRAMKNHENKEEASSQDEMRLNQGLLDALLGSNRQDAPADPSSQ